MNDEINKVYFDLRPVELKHVLHALWVSGEHAGERRVFPAMPRQSAVATMYALLKHGICAWIVEVQNENR